LSRGRNVSSRLALIGRGLETVVVRLPALGFVRPGEVHVTRLVAGELGRLPFGELIGDPADKDLQQRPELFSLGG